MKLGCYVKLCGGTSPQSVLSVQETLDFPAEFPAGYAEISAGNQFPADLSRIKVLR